MLNVANYSFTLTVIMLNVVMPSDVAPPCHHASTQKKNCISEVQDFPKIFGGNVDLAYLPSLWHAIKLYF
jgi:hypothetical protein